MNKHIGYVLQLRTRQTGKLTIPLRPVGKGKGVMRNVGDQVICRSIGIEGQTDDQPVIG